VRDYSRCEVSADVCSSACIVHDRELFFAVGETRLSRVKHDAKLPALAVQSCLDFAKMRAEQVDEVGSFLAKK